MNKTSKSVRVIKKNKDNENLTYFFSLTNKERLEHLEELRTRYTKWQYPDDSKSGFQRVYSITKRV
jgi:hypothetical protein